jgi:sulfate/thiosulfate transport system permease protein
VVDTVIAPPATARPSHSAGGGSKIGLRLVAVLYVSILVLLPVVLVVWRTFRPGFSEFFDALGQADTVHAFKLTAIVAGLAVVINTVFGVGVSLLLARYRFPGRGILSALIDLPVSISPIVVGLALILVYGNGGWLGSTVGALGIQIIGSIPGMVLATVFVSLPLVVRAIVPVLENEGTDQEQAAQSLGANALTRFVRITLPTIRAAAAYGIVLSIARCLGEYGAVLVVSGNIEGQTETATLRIDNLYETDLNANAAYAVTFVLVAIAVLAIVVITFIRRRQERNT